MISYSIEGNEFRSFYFGALPKKRLWRWLTFDLEFFLDTVCFYETWNTVFLCCCGIIFFLWR